MFKRIINIGIMPYLYQKIAKEVIKSNFDEFHSKYSVNILSNNYVLGNNICVDVQISDFEKNSSYYDISFYISKNSTFIVPQIKGFEFENDLTKSLEVIANNISNTFLNKSSARSTYPFNSEYLIAQDTNLNKKILFYQLY